MLKNTIFITFFVFSFFILKAENTLNVVTEKISPIQIQQFVEFMGNLNSIYYPVIPQIPKIMNHLNDGQYQKLDALVSDTACHLRALLTLDILSQIRQGKEILMEDFEALIAMGILEQTKKEQLNPLGLVAMQTTNEKILAINSMSFAEKRNLCSQLKVQLVDLGIQRFTKLTNIPEKDVESLVQFLTYENVSLKTINLFYAIYNILRYISSQNIPLIFIEITLEKQGREENSPYVLKQTQFRSFVGDGYFGFLESPVDPNLPAFVVSGIRAQVLGEKLKENIEFSVQDLILASASIHSPYPNKALNQKGSNSNMFPPPLPEEIEILKQQYLEMAQREKIGLPYKIKRGEEFIYYNEPIVFVVDHVFVGTLNYVESYLKQLIEQAKDVVLYSPFNPKSSAKN